MEFNITFGFYGITTSSKSNEWFSVDLDDVACAIPTDDLGTPLVTLREALDAEMKKTFILSVPEELREQITAAVDWENDLMISDIEVKDTTSRWSEPYMCFSLHTFADEEHVLTEMVRLYEWIEPNVRTEWTNVLGVLTFISDSGSRAQYFPYDNIDKWVQENFYGSYSSHDEYARYHCLDEHVPAGYTLTDEGAFEEEHDLSVIEFHSELMFYNRNA